MTEVYMRIMLVEDDLVGQRLAYNVLKAGFPHSEVVRIDSTGLFLKTAYGSLPELYGTDLVVMEHHLPLWNATDSEDDFSAVMSQLEHLFPEVVRNWDRQLAGERLVRWLREKGVKIPVLFYTHSPEEWIAADVRACEGVSHLKKVSDRSPLVDQVYRLVGSRSS